MAEILDSPSLKALSVDTRQEIMKLLVKRPYTPSELSRLLNKHVTTVGEHLALLEKSGLVRRKESSNKWVYYALTDKGEKIFKPNYYSWVVVLSLSLIAFVAGMQQMFFTAGYRLSAAQEAGKAYAPTSITPAAATDAATSAAAAAPIGMEIYVGLILISVSMLGFGYLIAKSLKNYSSIAHKR
ncbi:MAG: winged helix-turn-helix transcriptional regulator [Candidatus Aenigmarchaeota archaeon]|nr:winged helix-turn-helix transcriptional regulator [Candidatus Aenigmarchaeota archaeon]